MINETNYNNNSLTKEQEDKIDELFKQCDRNDAPGCAVGIIKDGRFIYKKSFGMGNLEHDIPITSDSKFDVCSITKQFTAACIALLQIDGKLNFDDDVRKFIPELPDYGKTITIKHLIFHTSGLKDLYSLMEMSGKNFDYGQSYFNNKDVVKRICKLKGLNFIPGEEYQYSNTGYLLLAEIISKVSGQSFSKFAQERIFVPLKMENSFINDNWRQVIKNRVVSYDKNDNGQYDTYVQISDEVGHSGLLTTVNDLLLWDQNYYSGKVGGDELKKIVSCQKTYVREEWEYGLGLNFYKYKNIPIVSHNGSSRAFESQMRRFPDYKTTIIVLCNTTCSASSLTGSITDVIFADIIIEPNTGLISKDEAKESFNSDLEISYKYAGKFYSGELDVEYQIKVEKNKLSIYIKDKKIADATLNKDNLFLVSEWDATLQFCFDDRNEITGLVVDASRAQDMQFVKQPE